MLINNFKPYAWKQRLAQFLNTSFQENNKTKRKKILTRNFTSFDQDNFKLDLHNIDVILMM